MPENNTITATQENNLPQEQTKNSPQISPAKVLYDRGQANNTTAPIQPVELVFGLTLQEQRRREEDPNLTLTELLGLTPCKELITTPLQTLDELYAKQPSRFLSLVQEAKKLAKKLKNKEEASQWSGIPIENILNKSFTEQLNYI